MGTLTVITEPTAEPVTLSELKAALGVDHSDDDVELLSLIKHSREIAEKYLNRYIMTQTIELSFDRFADGTIPLNVWPLASIDSVKYDDTSSPSAEITLTVGDDYYADTTTEGGRVSVISGWPGTYPKPNAVRIRMTAGYADADSVPSAIKRGIILWAGGIYKCPDYIESAKMTLRPFRIL
jgi:uncharacterized phiE125 gp8 family phage protein